MDNPDKESIAKDQPKTENPVENSAASSIHPHTQKFYMLLIILGVIFLASIFLAGLYFIGSRTTLNQKKQSVSQSVNVQKHLTPTIDPTTNWKTYTNTKYGFSFKYPSSLNLEETAKNRTSDIVVLVASNAKYPTLASRIHISVDKNTKNLTLDEYVKNIPTANNSGFRTFLIGGSEGRRGTVLGAYNHDSVFVLYNMFIYQLDL